MQEIVDLDNNTAVSLGSARRGGQGIPANTSLSPHSLMTINGCSCTSPEAGDCVYLATTIR